MTKRFGISTIGILFSLLLLLTSGLTALAAPATNVGLTRFEAIPQDNAVRLEWETATEVGTAGFQFKRTHNGQTDFLRTTSGSPVFINAEGEVAIGADYEYVDTSAENGETYTYELIEIESNGNEQSLDSRTVTVGVQATDTPVPINNGSNSGNATATSVPATATSRPTNTPSPTSTRAATATPRPTQAPTITPQPTATSAPTQAADTIAAAQPPATQVAPPYPVEGSNDSAETDTSPILDTDAVFAAGIDQQTEDPYPAPTVPTTTDETVPPAGDAVVPPVATPYPAGTDTRVIGEATPAAVGGTNGGQTPNQPTESTQQMNNSDTVQLYLIGGFIVALLIFITAVFGAIVLYTRKRTPHVS